MNNFDFFKVCDLYHGRSFVLLASLIKTCLATLLVTTIKIKIQFVKMMRSDSFITWKHFMEYPAS